ncbi:MAG: hypothetical protein JXB06_04545 [Spirochaetales bacterium]|nr:hypothetical protein [Spirochaetales bacterium]
MNSSDHGKDDPARRQHASESPGEILFLRVPPAGLVKPVGSVGRPVPARLRAVFDRDGFRGRAGQRSVTCFWIGMGRRVRVPGRRLLERIRCGEITEIIDIGCAGALDPALRRGDMVLSSDDIVFDGGLPVVVSRRPELSSILAEVAAGRGAAFRRAPILTHERFVARREQRIELFERTGCVAVQMEHAWFVRLLQQLLAADRFEKIRITHLVLITDAVPRGAGRRETMLSTWDALTGYTFPGGRCGIASLRREVLSRWPGATEPPGAVPPHRSG